MPVAVPDYGLPHTISLAGHVGARQVSPAWVEYVHAATDTPSNGGSRAHFYIGTFALQEALFGAERDDADALARGLAEYM